MTGYADRHTQALGAGIGAMTGFLLVQQLAPGSGPLGAGMGGGLGAGGGAAVGR